MKTEMNAKIIDVTIFRDGARVTRTGEVQLVPGEHIINVPGVSQHAHLDSFRVKGRGAAVLKSIDTKQISKVFEPEGALKELREKLEKLEADKKEILDRINHQNSRISYLTAISAQFTSEFGKWFAAGESSMDRLQEMDKTSMKLLREARKKLREEQLQLEVLEAEIQVIQSNIQRVQGQRRVEYTTEVLVTVEVTDNTTLELDITYQLSYAGWNPTYDIDIGEGTTSVKRIAMIYNNTLESWEDISLIVSTASARPVQAVEPTPYYVRVHTPSYGFASTGVGGEGRFLGSVAYDVDEELDDEVEELAGMVEEEPMVEVHAEVSETISGTVVYEVPGKVAIPSDDDSHPITLTEEEFESKRLHYWNAYAMSEVVAQDEITNGNSVLHPGDVRVYAAGEFLGETSLSLIAPREKFKLGTRTAYDMKAEKKLTSKDTDKAGFTRGKRKRAYEYSLEIKSFSKSPIEIRIADRIPYSQSEQIEVELTPPSLPTKKEPELGILEWETTLEPNTELKVSYRYQVEWEKDVRIRPPLP